MLAYQVKVTSPVGIPPAAAPVTVALSWTVEPIGAEVIAAAPAVSARSRWRCGQASFVAVSGSQGPVEVL